MNIQALKQKKRTRRKFSVRKKIFGTPERLRLSVYRSLNHISAQIIDDVSGTTLVAASTLEADVKSLIQPGTKKTDQSKFVGAALAKKAIAKNITTVVFDRNGFLYHGRVKALADAAREAGLKF
jgi:large subunit ribosomal protein L18